MISSFWWLLDFHNIAVSICYSNAFAKMGVCYIVFVTPLVGHDRTCILYMMHLATSVQLHSTPALPPTLTSPALSMRHNYAWSKCNIAKSGYCWWLWDWQRFPQAQSCPRTWQPLNFQLITWPSKLISSQLTGLFPIGMTKTVLHSTGFACLSDDWGYCGTFVAYLRGLDWSDASSTHQKATFITHIAT